MQTVILKTFDNYFSANITLTRLQDAGIHCYLNDEYTSTIYPIFNNVNGGIKLAVDILDETAATKMLLQFEEEYMKIAVCPKCNKNEFVLVEKAKKINFISSILKLLNKDTSTEMVYQCQHCKYETSTLPSNSIEYN